MNQSSSHQQQNQTANVAQAATALQALEPRVEGLDLARAIAFFGMVFVNFAVVMGAEKAGPVWAVFLSNLLPGRAAATFVVLAGVGITLMTRSTIHDRVRFRQARALLLRRGVFLFVVGLIYYPIWPGDILHFYGAYLFVASYLFHRSSTALLGSATVVCLGFTILLLIFDYEAGWNWETLEYSGFWTVKGFLRNLLFNGFHPVVPWLSLLLFGMWLGRQPLEQGYVRRKLFAWAAGVMLATEITSTLLVNSALDAGWESTLAEAIFGSGPMPPMPQYVVCGAATAVLVIVACAVFGQRYAGRGWLNPFLATGRLALTLYIGHVIVGMGALDALGLLRPQSLVFCFVVTLLFCGVAALFSYLWCLKYQRGPLEWLMRKITG